MNDLTYCVIGSGPSAISAASALASRGVRATILDAGVSLEPQQEEIKARLAAAEPEHWSSDDLAQLQKGMVSTTKGIPKKMVYGSDFAYRDDHSFRNVNYSKAKMTRSFAEGGLSNVWGACIAPYPADEMQAWPEQTRNLDEHYRAVLKFLPHVGGGPNGKLGKFSQTVGTLNPSSQASRMLADMEGGRAEMEARGISFGQSLLAVNQTNGTGCRYCGQCLYGCPYDLIYKSSSTLKVLGQKGSVDYLGGHIVERLVETNGGVEIHAKSARDGTRTRLKAKKVFLATGVLETARIMLESLEAYDTPVTARHSDRFMLPFMRFSAAGEPLEEKLHTLCQIFMEVKLPEMPRESVHLQLYTYNDLYKKALIKKLGPLYKPLQQPTAAFLRRLVIMFGYLHSDSSSELSIRLARKPANEIIVEGRANPVAKSVARGVAKTLLSNMKYLKGIPAIPFMDPPGGGNHTGGTFPMRERPGRFETDLLGRPSGFENLHIVDSSVFPSLPAATITFPVMANAHRIATNCEI